MTTIAIVPLLAIVFLVACSRRAQLVAACGDQSLLAERRGDSLALCVPRGFAGDSVGHRWVRGGAGDPRYLWFTITVMDSADAAFEWGSPPAPRTLASRSHADTSLPDNVWADSVRAHGDTVDGHPVVSETALLNGGAVGFNRSPVLRAVWRIQGQRWVLVQGFSTQPQQLDTLRQILRSMRIR